MVDSLLETLRNNLAAVEERIRTACNRVGRSRDEITLVAVTKSVSAEVACLLPGLGVHDLGEGRPQELWRKFAILQEASLPVRWHLVGHLQRNKVDRTLPLVHCIHSVDSLRLLEAIEKESKAQNLQHSVEVFLEVNASGEEAKHGFAPGDLPSLPEALLNLRGVRVVGLMTMAAFEADPEQTRSTFILLRQLRDQLRPQVAPVHPLHQLSMGMSNDFEVAIEEGATVVRLGTILFEGLPPGEDS